MNFFDATSEGCAEYRQCLLHRQYHPHYQYRLHHCQSRHSTPILSIV